MKSFPFYIILFLCCMTSTSVLSQKINIIPKPNHIEEKEGFFTFTKLYLYASEESKTAASYLIDALTKNINIENKAEKASRNHANAINFISDKTLGKEAYELEITNKNINICAASHAGWLYGSQTLLQILQPYITKNSQTKSLPQVYIKDAPRFAWRAFMLDEARHFKGKKTVKLLLDEMAYLKMNVFHWHLVDDQGWRIEIKKYPLLTTIGSKRKSTQIGPKQWDSPIQSAEPHEGFYTQEDIKEIIQYAAARNIKIVPEIEMPGHSSAAIAAYAWLGTSKQKIDVPIKFGVGLDVYDVADPKVVAFLKDVLDEVMALFPTDVIHIGGDEVKYNHWKNSKTVQAYMQENKLKTPADLQVYFTNTISNYLQSKGKRMMGWNEILGHNLHHYQDKKDTKTTQTLATNAIVHFWKGDITLASNAVIKGYDIVNSLHSNTYLDYDYKTISLKKAYDFEPIPKEIDAKYHSKIIGLGTQMWGEWIPTNGEMHYQVFPRIAAFAEVGWTKSEQKNYNQFVKSLAFLKNRWHSKNIYFAMDVE